MKYKKGQSGNPKGKPKGAKNKISKDIKETYKFLIENNADNLTEWLERIAKKNPEKALQLILNMSEFIIPKAKTNIDLSNSDGTFVEPITGMIIMERQNEAITKK